MGEVIIPVLLGVATVASTAYSIYSNVQAGHEATHERHQYERQLALKREADVKAERDRRQRTLARQESVYWGSGLTMEGSPLLVQADTIAKSEENLSRILEGSELLQDISESQGRQEEQATQYRTVQSGISGAYSAYNVGKGYNWWS